MPRCQVESKGQQCSRNPVSLWGDSEVVTDERCVIRTEEVEVHSWFIEEHEQRPRGVR